MSFLQTLSRAVASGHCKALVIGGFALEAYGFQRTTYDLDLLVGTTHLAGLETILLSAGYQEMGRNHLCVRYAHPDTSLMPVDVLLVADATWEKMWAASETFILEDWPVRVPPPAHAIALKLHAMRNDPAGRKNDFGDIIRILTHRPEALSPADLKNLCLRYAPPGLHEKILTALRHDS